MSNIWLQIKYLKYLPLEGFVDKGNHRYNFRCKICGDSQKSTTKKRGWATEYKNNLHISCFNCDYSSSFQKFLKIYYSHLYSDFIKEKYKIGDDVKLKHSTVDIFATEYDSLNLLQIKDLPTQHISLQYLKKRKLPKEIYNEFYYSDNYALWLNTEIKKDAIDYTVKHDRRIVIPYFNQWKKIFGMQARTIEYATPKYLNYKTDTNKDFIYGLDKIDFTKIVHVVEGSLDSLFIPNCLAVSGSLSNLNGILKFTSKENIIVITDNDKNNKYTDKFQLKLIQQGFKIVIWPKGTPFKDINEAIIKGLTKEEIHSIIYNNTFQGLLALSKFKMRRL